MTNRELARPSVAKTADYSIMPWDKDSVFTNNGAAAAITLTLPAIADVLDGWEVEVFGVADYKITVTAPSGKLIIFDNAGATSFDTNLLEANIGSHFRIRYDTNVDKYVAVIDGVLTKPTSVKTADYTVVATDDHKVFTNEGAAGAVNFTLPAIADVWDGWEIEVFVTTGQNVVVTAPAGKLVVFNNAAATSVTFSTAGELIGSAVRIRYAATTAKYLCFLMINETTTPTIA